jgi:hypothetical protein
LPGLEKNKALDFLLGHLGYSAKSRAVNIQPKNTKLAINQTIIPSTIFNPLLKFG